MAALYVFEIRSLRVFSCLFPKLHILGLFLCSSEGNILAIPRIDAQEGGFPCLSWGSRVSVVVSSKEIVTSALACS